jgi:pyruvate formate lyase activating enzyme
MKEASFFTREADDFVKCGLCPHGCRIAAGRSGLCGARRNESGTLMSVNYGITASAAFDPIEKKPLYHYHPGQEILSLGTLGCNLRCPFCQNHELSRYYDGKGIRTDRPVTPGDVIKMLDRADGRIRSLFKGIAYTYSEPIVWYEFVRDTSELVRNIGGKNILVTNGFINKKPLEDIAPLIDAANVDLKAFTEPHYAMLGGRLAPVLASIETMKKNQWHVEITTLIVTGFNDNVSEIEQMAKWIASIDKTIPYHLSRYFPQYKYVKPATDVDFMHEARAASLKHLNYVYMGNMGSENDTACPSCGAILVERTGYGVNLPGFADGRCAKCGRDADIVL